MFKQKQHEGAAYRTGASWVRIAAPAVFLLAQSLGFLWFFQNSLGGVTSPFVPHMTLSVLLVASMYGLAIAIEAVVRWRHLRGILLWLVSLAGFCATTIFYLSATFTLFGFRDLPTSGVIIGYFTQIPAMAESLPIPAAAIIVISFLVFALFLATSAGIAWCLAGLRQSLLGSSGPSIRPSVALAPASIFLLLVIMPPPGFIAQYEPWLRSLYNRPLTESGLGLQSNPVEEAHDRELEASYPRAPMGNRLNVILIYIDGLRSDVLQPYGSGIPNMPFMQSLVSDGQLQQYPRTFATCSMTLCGLGSLLQSRPAHRISVGNLSLPKVLRQQGYETRYLLSGDHQHFLALKQYYGSTPEFYMDGFDLDPARSNDDLFVFQNLNRLPKASATQPPQFIMLGLMSVHIWGKRHNEFRRWRPDKLRTISFSNIDNNSTEAYRNNYMNGILQSDHALKTIWAWLETAGYLQSSIVIITSDHGDSLGENGHLGHARSLHTPELLTPLWVHTPNGTIPSRDPVFQDDIAPTILDYLGLPIPASWTGQSLLKQAPSTRWLPLYYINNKDKFGLILTEGGRTLKYLVDYSTHSETLYDLDNDLFEHHDILNKASPAVVDRFRSKLQSTFGTMLSTPQKPSLQ